MFYDKFFGIFDRLRKQTLRQKTNDSEVYRSRRYQRNVCSSIEQLETRIALSANSIALEAEGDRPNGWGVITLDSNEDDLYLRATQEIDFGGGLSERIEFAEDASFENPGSITQFTGWYKDILVTAGHDVDFNTADPILGIEPVMGKSPSFALPDAGNPLSGLSPSGWTVPSDPFAHHMVPGTVRGRVTLEHQGQFRSVSFTPRFLYDVEDGTLGDGVDALFANEFGVPLLSAEVELNDTTVEDGEPVVTKIKVTITGQIFDSGIIRFTYETTGGEDSDEVWTPDGGSTIDVQYATPIVPEGPSAVTLAAGRDFFLGLQVDLPGPDSSITIASPLVTNPDNDNDIALAASTIEVDAPITSKSNFLVTPTSRAFNSELAIGGSRATVVERFQTNTTITSQDFGVSVADDDRTDLRTRSSVEITPSGDWNATRLSVRGIESDFVFAGNVVANDQSYFLRTSSDQKSHRFVTDGEGSLSGSVVDITLDNVEPIIEGQSVVHDVFLNTSVDSLRISAEGDNSVETSVKPSTFDIAIEEEDAINIEAVVRTGAGFKLAASGEIQLTSSIDSFGDVSIQSQQKIFGEAEISTVNGTVALSGSEVNVTGNILVLNANYDETTTDVRMTSTSGPLAFGAISATNGITLIQTSPDNLNSGVRSVATVVGNKLDIVSDGNVDLTTNVNEAVIVSGGAVTINEEDDAVFNVVATGLTTLTAQGVDPLGEDVNGNGVLDNSEDTNGNGVLDEGTALVATVRDTNEVIVSAPQGSVEVLAVTSDVLTIGNLQSLVGFNAAETRAAGNVSIRSTQGDIVVLDAPQAGVGVLSARAASDSGPNGNLPGVFAYNQPGITPSTITASSSVGSLNNEQDISKIFPGFGANTRLRVRDIVLLRGQSNPHENGLYQITDLGSLLRPWVLTRTSTTSVTSGLPINSRIAVQDGDFAGESFRVQDYASLLNETPLHVAAGYKRSPDEISVRAVTDATLLGEFDVVGGEGEGSITGVSVEDVNLNGVLDPGEDLGNGVLDTEDTNGNGVLDTEDTNGNGVLDPGEDLNANGVLDTEDANGNGQLDTEDTNGNGLLDPGEDLGNGVLDAASQLIVSGVSVEDGDLILVRFGAASDVSEDTNGNGVLDSEDTNGNGALDPGEDLGNGVLDSEDTNGNGVLDTEDTNGNGVLDPGEDLNGNGVLDTEDTNGNGALDTEDTNGNGVLDPGEDLGNGVLDTEDTNGNGVLDLGSLAEYPSARPNGIYQAIIDGVSPWRLERWISPDGGPVDPVDEAVVVVEDGFYRTSVTGQSFTVRFDGLGLSDLSISDPRANPTEKVQLQLGSYDPRDAVDFVVSTNGKTNTSPGSLGRMLKLVQENQARDFNDEIVEQAILFGNVLGGFDGITGTIELQQELPEISRPFVLDAANRYPLTTDSILPIVIDGSRITSTREGTFVVDDEINGFDYKGLVTEDTNGNGVLDTEDTNGNGVLDTEDTNGNGVLDPGEDENANGQLDTEDANGNGLLDIEDTNGNGFLDSEEGATGGTSLGLSNMSPEDATRSVLRGLQMGGFESGAAVRLDSVSNVLVEQMTIGLNAQEKSQAVKYGIEVTGDGVGRSGPVTLLDNNIYSASISGGISNPIIGAGILIESNSGASMPTDYVQVVGGSIGQPIGSNASGIEVRTHDKQGQSLDGLAGNMIGANPLSTISNLSVTQNKATVVLDAETWSTYGNDLYLGQQVSSSAFLPGTVIAFIEKGRALEDVNNDGVPDAEDTNGNGVLDPGEDINNNGKLDFSRYVTMSERATLTNIGGQDIQFGSGRATSEDLNGNGVLDIGEDINSNGLLDEGSRVLVSSNFTGVKIESGKVRVVNTEVSNNVLNGVDIGQNKVPASASPLEVVLGDGLSNPQFQRQVNAASQTGDKYVAGSVTLTLESVLPISQGMRVTDSVGAIAGGTTVVGVDPVNNQITLSAATEGELADGIKLTFEGLNPKIRSEASNAIFSNGQYGIRFLESVRFLEEDSNNDGVINDADIRPVVLQGNYVGKEHQAAIEPGNLRANFQAENVSEDDNGNGVLDTEDTNGNGVLDPGEDLNGNGLLDTEDTNENGTLDVSGAGLRSHESFKALFERHYNYSAEATQYDFGDRNNNVNSEIGVPLVATLAPSSLTWEPGRQLIRLSWVAPETNSSTGAIGGYQIHVVKGNRQWYIDFLSVSTRYDLEKLTDENGTEIDLIDGQEYQVSVAAILVDANGSRLSSPNDLSAFSSFVTAIPAQPAGAPVRRPTTRF